jgi:hypothetical protein
MTCGRGSVRPLRKPLRGIESVLAIRRNHAIAIFGEGMTYQIIHPPVTRSGLAGLNKSDVGKDHQALRSFEDTSETSEKQA